ncbi:SBBP repeat-containing protein [Sorangium sp. So ce327]|uniref:DUF7948 domain-containing protein n=1 Tax=Sorangium sp. So ce327 TaxID=3133301 RepID=UPI003F641162
MTILRTALLLGGALGLSSCDHAVPGRMDGEAPAAPDDSAAGSQATLVEPALHFIESRGAAESASGYHVQGRDKAVHLGPDGITFVLAGAPEASLPRWAVRLEFEGHRAGVVPEGKDPTGAVVSYFTGPREQWRTGLPTYAAVVYEDLWPGVDLEISGTAHALKYQLVVAPGADPAQIRLTYRGASAVRLTEGGQIEISTPAGSFTDDAPLSFQDTPEGRAAVPSAYALEAPAPDGAQTYGLRLGAYDPTLPLVIDPAVLITCGFIGGSGSDDGEDIAVDLAGKAYVTGSTTSTRTTFPDTVGPDLKYNGGQDAFVAKVDPQGALVYAGYIGGSGFELGRGIAVDWAGHAHVTGITLSNDFPVEIGPDLTYNGQGDAFIVKIDASGKDLAYAGYIGGAGTDLGFDVAVDSCGDAYVTGRADSNASTFPAQVGPDLTQNGGADAFVAKVDASGAGFVYVGYIGGSAQDEAFSIAVDWAGAAYVTGWTFSGADSFPVQVGPDLSQNDGGIAGDAFVAKVSPAGTGLEYAGYIGGAGSDVGQGIDVDLAGNAYISGNTASDELTFPVKIGPDLTYNGAEDAFVAKVSPSGAELVYAGYVGGTSLDGSTGLAVDLAGRAYLTGATSSADFPAVGGPDLTHNGDFDAFVTKIDASGASLVYSGFIGGSSTDAGRDIAVHWRGDAFVAGFSYSTEATFPTVSGPDLTHNGDADAFVARIRQTRFLASP